MLPNGLVRSRTAGGLCPLPWVLEGAAVVAGGVVAGEVGAEVGAVSTVSVDSLVGGLVPLGGGLRMGGLNPIAGGRTAVVLGSGPAPMSTLGPSADAGPVAGGAGITGAAALVVTAGALVVGEMIGGGTRSLPVAKRRA